MCVKFCSLLGEAQLCLCVDYFETLDKPKTASKQTFVLISCIHKFGRLSWNASEKSYFLIVTTMSEMKVVFVDRLLELRSRPVVFGVILGRLYIEWRVRLPAAVQKCFSFSSGFGQPADAHQSASRRWMVRCDTSVLHSELVDCVHLKPFLVVLGVGRSSLTVPMLPDVLHWDDDQRVPQQTSI